MAASGSTALRGGLWAGHLAARPCAPRPSPMALGVVGLIPGAPPPAHAVGTWPAAGALGHSGARGALFCCFNPLRTWIHRPALGFSRDGENMKKSLPPPSRAGRAQSRPAAAFALRPLQGYLHQARRCRALSFNPGALEAPCGCGGLVQKVRPRSPRSGTKKLASALSRAPLRRLGPEGPTGHCARAPCPEPVRWPS